MKNIKKLFRSFFTGASASDTYVIIDDGSEDLKGKPIEDFPAPAPTFETIISPTSAVHNIVFTKNKTIVRASINNNAVITADVTGLTSGDEALIIVTNTIALNVDINFNSNFDMLGSTTAYIVPGNNGFLVQSFIFDGTNLILKSKPSQITA